MPETPITVQTKREIVNSLDLRQWYEIQHLSEM